MKNNISALATVEMGRGAFYVSPSKSEILCFSPFFRFAFDLTSENAEAEKEIIMKL